MSRAPSAQLILRPESRLVPLPMLIFTVTFGRACNGAGIAAKIRTAAILSDLASMRTIGVILLFLF
jgi:hypothetical protein